MSNFNKEYSQYYDLLYSDKNYVAESEYILNTLKDHSKSLDSLLELGCGSGNHAQHLSHYFKNIVGIDLSEKMCEEAKNKKVKNLEVINNSIVDYRVDKKFNIAISLFHVISYITDNNDLINCFKNTHTHLEKDGLFLFDVWYAPAVNFLKPENKIKKLSDDKIDCIRITEPIIRYNENIVDVNFKIIVTNKANNQTSIFQEKHPMRYFSLPELNLLAQLTGFEIILAEEFLTKKELSENTWGACVLMKKV